jgi:hypothetical protein
MHRFDERFMGFHEQLIVTGSRCSWETASWSSAVFISEHQDASSEGRTRGGRQGCGLDIRRSRIHMAAISCRVSDCVASWWLQMREWCTSATIRLTVVPFAKLRIVYWRRTLADNTLWHKHEASGWLRAIVSHCFLFSWETSRAKSFRVNILCNFSFRSYLVYTDR